MAPVPQKLKNSDLSGIIWAGLTILFVFSMVSDPQGVFTAAQKGVQAWWNIVFPALLPFFIASDLLINLGIVRFLGTLLHPIMRPLFNLPGDASFVMAIGYTSGYPIGSTLTAQLRSQGQITRLEGERLMAFTNNASPLFMLCAVAIGMFHNPNLGILIALAHYLANLTIGIMLRFYGRKDPETIPHITQKQGLLRQALHEMLKYQRHNYQPLGSMLSEAVKKSIQQLFSIGGFIIIFSVIISIMDQVGILSLFSRIFGVFITPLGFSSAITEGLAWGFFEITLGVKKISETQAPLWEQAIAISLILAWCGVSVQAQVASMVSKTDLRMGLFICCRIAHALLSAVFCRLLAPQFLTANNELASTVLSWNIANNPSWWNQLKFYTLTSGLDIVLLLLLALTLALLSGSRFFWFWIRGTGFR